MSILLKYLLSTVFSLGGILLLAQSPYYLPGTQASEIADRWDVLYWDQLPTNFTSIGNIDRRAISKIAATMCYDPDGIFEKNKSIMTFGTQELIFTKNKLDQYDSRYLLADNINYRSDQYDHNYEAIEKQKRYDTDGVFYSMEENNTTTSSDGISIRSSDSWNLFGTFYKTRANFFSVQEDNFQLIANPILHLSYGNGKDDGNTIFRNIRGVEIHGTIDDNFYYYTNIVESQARFNNFIENRIQKFKAIPGQGAYKNYDSGIIDNLTGWDFLNSQAYVGANISKSISVEFGHGKHFIGNGIRSLLLSDYANNYFYLKFSTKVWKFKYQNLFAELSPISNQFLSGDELLPKKYMASHYLSYAPRKNMEIGLFETVVFSRQNQFELQYLNPVILYRTVEQFLDSPDNVLIGINGKWNIINGVQLYGQVLLDEFNLSEITAGNGWWANKYGLQGGVKYYNVANIDHLDIQVEVNIVRPYTYAHRDTLQEFPEQNVASYTHYNQPLAHPLGSNFKEFILEVRYRPIPKLSLKLRAVKALYGQDGQGQNYGSNPLLPLENREADYGNFIGQGIETDINLVSFDMSYQFYHNYHIDLRYLRRTEDAVDDDLDVTTNFVGLGLRVNLGMVNWDY